jgi:hypothetical protein
MILEYIPKGNELEAYRLSSKDLKLGLCRLNCLDDNLIKGPIDES